MNVSLYIRELLLTVSVQEKSSSLLIISEKTVSSSTGSAPSKDATNGENAEAAPAGETTEKKEDENEFASKAQIMTLMTTDVDRVSEFAYHLFTLV